MTKHYAQVGEDDEIRSVGTADDVHEGIEIDEEAYLLAVRTFQAGVGAWLRDGVVVPMPRDAIPDVDAERDRRMLLPLTFAGKVYDADEKAQGRIEKARLSATAAVMAGAQAGDVEWPGAGIPFTWIAADNSLTPMDAQTTVAFGSALATREGLLIMAARVLKDRLLAGETIEDLTDDTHWTPPA